MNDFIFFFVMFILSAFTAALSAATGMGGGIIFLVGLNFYLPLSKVIPIHGLVQMKNNLLRVIALRQYLKKDICIPYSIGCLVGVILIINLQSLMTNKLFPLIIIFILVNYSIFKPKKLPELKLNPLGFGILGLITGFLGIIIGAVDPLLSPFFVREDFERQTIIANKSYFQSLVHFSKIPVFIHIGFDYIGHWQLVLVLLIGGVVGTGIGIKLLHLISQEIFKLLFKSILFLVGIKLAYNIYNLL